MGSFITFDRCVGSGTDRRARNNQLLWPMKCRRPITPAGRSVRLANCTTFHRRSARLDQSQSTRCLALSTLLSVNAHAHQLSPSLLPVHLLLSTAEFPQKYLGSSELPCLQTSSRVGSSTKNILANQHPHRQFVAVCNRVPSGLIVSLYTFNPQI